SHPAPYMLPIILGGKQMVAVNLDGGT
ncbi:MAG: hypothetical protein ACI9W6_000470, partial [Motiliproteus sp.]